MFLFVIKKVGLKTIVLSKVFLLNPIPAGVLENQDTLGGGGQFDPPPSLNPMFYVQI